MYRVNTFPLIHLNFFHALFNILALAPLLDRFETEFGTLTSLALFFGRKCAYFLQDNVGCRLGGNEAKVNTWLSFDDDTSARIHIPGKVHIERKHGRHGS